MTQPRTPPPTLSFDEIKTRRKGQVEFPTVAYRDFTEVKRQISPFSRKMEANLEVFRDQLFARIKAVNGLDVERAIVYWVAAHGKHRLRCIAYQTGRRVFPLAIEAAGNLRAWIDAITKPFAPIAGLQLTLNPNQTGCLRCAPPQLVELEANPIKLIKLWAPEHFDLAGLARDKQKFFKNFEDVPGPLEAFDPARFAALLDEFLALRKHRGAAPKPAAVDAWQARLEQQVGARLPADRIVHAVAVKVIGTRPADGLFVLAVEPSQVRRIAAVDERHRHADGDAAREGLLQATRPRAVEHQRLAHARVDHRDHERCAVCHEADVCDETRIEDRVDHLAIVLPALGCPSNRRPLARSSLHRVPPLSSR